MPVRVTLDAPPPRTTCAQTPIGGPPLYRSTKQCSIKVTSCSGAASLLHRRLDHQHKLSVHAFRQVGSSLVQRDGAQVDGHKHSRDSVVFSPWYGGHGWLWRHFLRIPDFDFASVCLLVLAQLETGQHGNKARRGHGAAHTHLAQMGKEPLVLVALRLVAWWMHGPQRKQRACV